MEIPKELRTHFLEFFVQMNLEFVKKNIGKALRKLLL